MNNICYKTMLGIAASTALITGVAMAHEGGMASAGYLGDSSGHYVTDSSGHCVYTSSWTRELATKECNPELFPEEVAAAPAPPPMPVYEKHTISATALFDFDKYALKPEGKEAISGLVDEIKASTAKVIDINVVGHTDSIGTEEYNQELSVRRANAVKEFMVSEGIDPGIIDVKGMGEADPVASNATAEGRAQNRRVEISVAVETPK
ncbi:MAG: OmpA family protein [Gammaproteobacteria bacterium]